MREDHYDAVIIGSGQGGTPMAKELAQLGRKTALIERDLIGGTCINVGCTPTKTMAASAEAAHWSRKAGEYGLHAGSVTVDMKAVRQRKRNMVDSFRGSSQEELEKTENLDLIFAEARFAGPKALEVNSRDAPRRITTDWIIIDTGGRSRIPPLEGLDGVPFLDSTSIMELDEIPGHLVILGGGYEALEFGQMFRRFGSDVTIVQHAGQLMEREDPDVAAELQKILKEDGIDVLLNATTERVELRGNDVRLIMATPKGERNSTGSHLLVCVGRTPNTDKLNLEAAGVKVDEHGYVEVNDRLETTAEGVYAIGDVKGGPAFTHIAYDDFRILRANLLRNGNASTKDRLVPYTMFTDPQLGRVGITETEAKAKGLNIRVAKLPMTSVARGLESGRSRGFLKAVVDADTKQILGCAMLCMEGGELMAAVEIAMMGKLPYTVLKEGIFAHPTLAESLNNLFLTLDD